MTTAFREWRKMPRAARDELRGSEDYLTSRTVGMLRFLGSETLARLLRSLEIEVGRGPIEVVLWPREEGCEPDATIASDAAFSRGILTGFCNDLLIENNVTSRAAAEHGIYVSNSAKRYVVRNNISFGNRACGIHNNGDVSLGGDGINSDALIEGNVLYDNGVGGGSAINCDGVQNSVIRNNLIYDQHASGISLYRIDGGGPSTGNLIVNNTILLAGNGRWNLNLQDAATGNTAYNNILENANLGRGSISISVDSLAGFTSDYNSVVDRFTTDGGNTRLSLVAWRMMTGQDRRSFLAAPAALFVNAAAHDYHLAAMSPALDTGTPMKAPAADIEGNPRPAGGGFDVGAYERCGVQGCGPPDGGLGPDLVMPPDASMPDAAVRPPDASMADAAVRPPDAAVMPIDASVVDASAAAADLAAAPADLAAAPADLAAAQPDGASVAPLDMISAGLDARGAGDMASGSTPAGCGCQVGGAGMPPGALLLHLLPLVIWLRRRSSSR